MAMDAGNIPGLIDARSSDLLTQTQPGTSEDLLRNVSGVSSLESGSSAAASQPNLLSDSCITQEKLLTFWQTQMDEIQILSNEQFKTQELPLARIKKIMKMDEDVKMISAEAPLLFSKAAQIFITELSLRAWIHTEESKRRTLQRNDIATAITKFDQFDFLIDIVPREELKTPPKRNSFGIIGGSGDAPQFFYSSPQVGNNTTTTVNNNSSDTNTQSATASALQTGQLLLAQQNQNGQPMTLTPVNMDGSQVLQLSQPTQSGQQNQQIPGLLMNQSSINNNNQNQQSQLDKQSQEQISDQSLLNMQQKPPQTAQQILQQLVSNLPGTAGGVHTIQLNSQGQLQLVKVPEKSQAQGSSNAEGTTEIASVEGGQVFNLPANISTANDQQSQEVNALYVNSET
ncbi:uncharacterized protein LOC120346295 [Styela clava]